jgi:hypothetical protein
VGTAQVIREVRRGETQQFGHEAHRRIIRRGARGEESGTKLLTLPALLRNAGTFLAYRAPRLKPRLFLKATRRNGHA